MTAFLPPSLLALFAPREPLIYFPPLDELPLDKKPWPYNGVAQFLAEFEDPTETPVPTRGETKDERRARKRAEREERYRNNLDAQIKSWDPANDTKISGDPFKTLFVGRINYDTSESKLRREFESYGTIRHIHMVYDVKQSKPRGYAFIEYENERDMHSAYKYADGKKIDGKRVVVDVERGRTVKSWKPRRLGGGLGGTRRGAPNECIKYSGRIDERDVDREKERDRDKERDDRRRDKDRGDKDRGEKDRGEKDRGRSERERGDRGRRNSRRSHSRDRDRDRRRARSRSREKEREKKDRSRSRGDRERDKDKGRDKKDRSRSRERHKKDKKRDKDRDHERGKDRREKEVKKEPQPLNGQEKIVENSIKVEQMET